MYPDITILERYTHTVQARYLLVQILHTYCSSQTDSTRVQRAAAKRICLLEAAASREVDEYEGLAARPAEQPGEHAAAGVRPKPPAAWGPMPAHAPRSRWSRVCVPQARRPKGLELCPDSVWQVASANF
jgi:hypothetical protein